MVRKDSRDGGDQPLLGRHAEAVCAISVGKPLYTSPNPEERTLHAEASVYVTV